MPEPCLTLLYTILLADVKLRGDKVCLPYIREAFRVKDHTEVIPPSGEGHDAGPEADLWPLHIPLSYRPLSYHSEHLRDL